MRWGGSQILGLNHGKHGHPGGEAALVAGQATQAAARDPTPKTPRITKEGRRPSDFGKIAASPQPVRGSISGRSLYCIAKFSQSYTSLISKNDNYVDRKAMFPY
jgi:hypothetical protein